MADKNGAPTFDIPTECIGGVVVNEGPDFEVQVQKVPVPEIGPDDVLIKLNATGLCMSDVHFMMHDWAAPAMSTLGVVCAGHEGAGVIVKVGDRVKHLKVGQRAGLKPVWDTCGTCEQCRTGRDNYCQASIHTGGTVDGSYKQYVKSPARYTTIIPDGVSDFVAGPVMCSASTVYHALKSSGLRAGQWACFPGGGGGVGVQGVQLATAMGLKALVVDTGAERRALVDKAGAVAFVDFNEVEDPCAEVFRITGGGAHGVFVTAVQAYAVALDYMGSRPGAVVVCIGLPPDGKYHIDVDPNRLAFTNQSIKGVLVSPLHDVDETLEFARSGKLKIEPTVVGLSQWNESVQKLKNGQVAGRIVVDFNKP